MVLEQSIVLQMCPEHSILLKRDLHMGLKHGEECEARGNGLGFRGVLALLV